MEKLGKKLIQNGIYTCDKNVYIVLNDQECLGIRTSDILRESNKEELWNEDVSLYLSAHFNEFTIFDMYALEFMKEKDFQGGYLGTLNQVAIHNLDKFKQIWE